MDGKLEIPANTSLIKGRYLIWKVLGRGGLRSTYLTLDTRYLNKHSILKEFALNGSDQLSWQKIRELLKREAEILYQIHHPQIPNLLSCFETNGSLFLVQEYVQGQTYSTLIKQRQVQRQVFSEDEVIQLLADLLPVLDYIHKHGIIHRDISPSNIMLPTADHLPVLIDFGIGQHISTMSHDPGDNDSSFISNVRKLFLVGKVGYAPYEQIELGICSPSSDLYALGVTAVALLSGKEPPNLVNQSYLQWQLQAYATISKAFTKILNKMLADTPVNRYQSATEVLRDLQSLKQFKTAPLIPLRKALGSNPDSFSGVFRSANHLEKTTISSPPKKLERSAGSAPSGVIAQRLVAPALALINSRLNSGQQNLLRLAIHAVVRAGLLSAPFALATWLAGSRLPNPISTPESSSHTAQSDQRVLAEEATAIEPPISTGEKSLIPILATPQKQAGIEAFKLGDYRQTTEILAAYLEANRNDPEARIYLNNAQIGEQPAYTIAVAVPLGGNLKVALEQLRGVAQAQINVNQTGGVNGFPLKVVIANDHHATTTAQRIAAELTVSPNILGVVGHHASEVMRENGEIYASGDLVTVSPTPVADPSQFGRYVFRTGLQDRLTAEVMVKGMLQLKHKTAAVFYNSQSEYSQSLMAKFTHAFSSAGGRVLAEFDLFSPDFEAGQSYQKALQQGVEVMVLLPDNSQIDNALKVVKIAADVEIDHRKRHIFAAHAFCLAKVLEAGAQTVGMIIADPWQSGCGAYTEFVQAFRQVWNAEVSHHTIAAYDATQVLVAAIQRNPNRKGVQQALSSADFTAKGAIGDVQFLDSGDRNHSIQLVKIEPSSDSTYGYNFIPLP